jgi:predicted RNA binding protein YcfA (HicA-like mRNA interferase family)
MSKLPSLTGGQVVKALLKTGFIVVRQKGSHIYLRDSDGRSTVVPVHKGESLGKGLLKKILHDTELEKDELIRLLH